MTSSIIHFYTKYIILCGKFIWTKSYSKVFKGIKKEAIWQLWADVNNWNKWDPDIEYTRMEGDFKVGNFFILKPKGGPSVKIRLIEVERGDTFSTFTDCTHFIGAKMYGRHEMAEEDGSLRLTTTMTVTGILGFVWRKLVAEGIIKAEPEEMEKLVELARKVKA